MISGINNSSCLRLKWTKARLPKRSSMALSELEILTNMEGSFKNYRAALSTSNLPAIPYIGVYLGDLTFIEDGNPDKLGNLINFQKRKMIYSIIEAVRKFQAQPYDIQVADRPWMKNFIDKIPILPENELYRRSLEIEPRNAGRSDIQ
eukprot:TRINITY_DN12151_c0_g1_i1.p1 TRINITY_DN12151_c0_g1~~TRINITY_DN12151_c0_g1_i1.p1  ORF type:complete len:148 (-),score=21.92 TRINITY_DN12151_c0_g1_i1:5-448(-)